MSLLLLGRLFALSRGGSLVGAFGCGLCRVTGQLFWASSNDLVYRFDYHDTARHIVIDLSQAEVWDASTVATLDAIRTKYEAKGLAAGRTVYDLSYRRP